MGWGNSWFPGLVRELLPGGDIQVLWEGDEPSISNVSRACVRLRGDNTIGVRSSLQEPRVDEGQASACRARAVEDLASSSATSSLPVLLPDANDNSKLHEASTVLADGIVGASIPQVISASASTSSAHSYHYDFGPGDDIAMPIANLRRRIEVELRDGCVVSLSLHVVRPEGAPASVSGVSRPAEPSVVGEAGTVDTNVDPETFK